MSENVRFMASKKTTLRAPVARSRNTEVLSRVATNTARMNKESSRAVGLSSQSLTVRSGDLRKNTLTSITTKSSFTVSTARGIVAPGRVHIPTPPLPPRTESLRARMPSVANAVSGTSRTKMVGRGGRLPVTVSSSPGVRAAGLCTSTSQKVQPRRSARLQTSVSLKTEAKTAEETLTTPPSLKRQSSFGRSSPGENVFYCPICFENIKNTGGRIVVLPCGHVFCRDCLFASFQKKKHCPLCQVAFNDPANIMEIFL